MSDPIPSMLLAILLPVLAAAFMGRAGRGVAVAAAAGSFILSATAAWTAFGAQPVLRWGLEASTLPLAFMTVFSGVALAVIAAAPKGDAGPESLRGYLLILAGHLLTYGSDHVLFFLVGWAVSILPVWLTAKRLIVARVVLAASVAALGGAFALLAAGNPDADLSLRGLTRLPVDESFWIFGLMMLAVMTLKGIFPFQSWVAASAEGGSFLGTSLLVNGHLGAFLVARIAIPMFPQASQQALGIVSNLALATALYAAVAALAAKEPRRILALLVVGQSSFVLTGLQSGTAEGATGAWVFLFVISIASTGMFLVYRALEVRVSVRLTLAEYYGFVSQTPRFAVFFAVCALAAVGLPGTLGFCAEDLLLHGTLAVHPILGLILPVATALTAFQLVRLFSSLFLGKRASLVPLVQDALPRERLVLTAFVLLLVVLGLFPGRLVNSYSEALWPLANSGSASERASIHDGVN